MSFDFDFSGLVKSFLKSGKKKTFKKLHDDIIFAAAQDFEQKVKSLLHGPIKKIDRRSTEKRGKDLAKHHPQRMESHRPVKPEILEAEIVEPGEAPGQKGENI